MELQRKLGGNPDVDVPYQYLSFFLESDEELAELRRQYIAGELLTGEMKAKCIKELQQFVVGFQERRKAITEEMVQTFMDCKRPLEWGQGRKTETVEVRS